MKKEKTPQEHYVVFTNLLFIGVVLILVSILFKDTVFFWVLWGLGLLIAIAGVAYRGKYFKCPHCGGKLNVRGLPKHCPDCGGKIL